MGSSMLRAVTAAIVMALGTVGVGGLGKAIAQGPRPDSRPVPSRRTALTIPFRIAPAANPNERPVEVQLMVSANRGLQWQHAGSARPEAGKIAFNASGDGEYWFCVKTKDAGGRIHPAGPPLAELRVLVDATRPQLRLNVWRGVDGDVTARWEATDANLNPQTFKIQYRRSGTDEPWQPLAVAPPLADARGSYADMITWKSTTPVDVQVEIADLAGNVEIHTMETGPMPSAPVGGIGAAPAESGASRPSAATGSPVAATPGLVAAPAGAASPAVSSPGGLSAQGTAQAAAPKAPLDLPWQTEPVRSIPWAPEAAQAPPARPRSWELGAASPTAPSARASGPETATRAAPVDPFAARQGPSTTLPGSAASPWPAVGAITSPFPSRLDAASRPAGAGAASSPPAAAGHVTESLREPQSPLGEARPRDMSSQAPAGTVSNPFAPAATGAVSSPAAATGQRPPWLVNSRVMEVAYDLGAINAADVRAVELWGTADGGQNWRKVAADDDRRSPVVARVDADGLYGFRLLVARHSGPIELPPAVGQSPELLVEVDQTEPRCQLTRVDQMPEPRSGELVIAWQASDRRLAERPVTLCWGHNRTGPWRTIAVGLENTGSYTWHMPEGLPDEVFLRLEVRDAADNLGQFTTDRPISPQLPKPPGRLRGVQGVNAGRVTDRRAEPRTYFFR
jgi:hypothetical protein